MEENPAIGYFLSRGYTLFKGALNYINTGRNWKFQTQADFKPTKNNVVKSWFTIGLSGKLEKELKIKMSGTCLKNKL